MNNAFLRIVRVIVLSALLASCGATTTSRNTAIPSVPATATAAATVSPTLPSPMKLSTGFFWPTNPAVQAYYAGFMADSCTKLTGNDHYFYQKYHVGTDIQAGLDSQVIAIADGTVLYYSHDASWGTDNRDGEVNDGLVIKHSLDDPNHSVFYAVYGHIRTELRVGSPVTAGQKIGTVGMWRYQDDKNAWIRGKDHLHFGIQPGDGFLNPLHWGIMDCPAALPIDQKGYVDPIEFIENHRPGPIPSLAKATSIPTVFPTIAPASNGGVSGNNWIAFIGFDENIWLVHPDGSSRTQITFDGKPSSSGSWGDPIVGYRNITWSPDGSMLGMLRIDGNDARIQAIHMPDLAVIPLISNVEGSFDWLPDGKTIIYSDATFEPSKVRGNQPGGLSLINLSTREITRFIDPGSGLRLTNPHWSPRGGNVFFRVDTAPRPQGISASWLGLADSKGGTFVQDKNNDAFCDWSPDGTRLACRLGTGEILCSGIGLFSPGGELLTTITPGKSCYKVNNPTWSPDGSLIAFEDSTGGSSIVKVMKSDNSGDIVMTTHNFGTMPKWSPDGKMVAFISGTSWNQDIYRAFLAGGGMKNISMFKPGVSWFAWQPSNNATPPTTGPTNTPGSTVIDLRDSQSIIKAFADGLRTGKIEPFETIFTEDTLMYGTGMAEKGGRESISKADFMKELAKRLPSRPACAGYVTNSEGTFLWIFTTGWQPKWDLFGKPTSSELAFSLLLQDGKVSTTAYFTPSAAILGAPNVKSLRCP